LNSRKLILLSEGWTCHYSWLATTGKVRTPSRKYWCRLTRIIKVENVGTVQIWQGRKELAANVNQYHILTAMQLLLLVDENFYST